MDPRKFMIITKGKVSTKQIRSCTKNASTHKFDIVFENGKKFSYAQNNPVACLDYSRVCKKTGEYVAQDNSDYGSDKVFNPNLHNI